MGLFFHFFFINDIAFFYCPYRDVNNEKNYLTFIMIVFNIKIK